MLDGEPRLPMVIGTVHDDDDLGLPLDLYLGDLYLTGLYAHKMYKPLCVICLQIECGTYNIRSPFVDFYNRTGVIDLFRK